jgi:hypothetical protein
VYQLNIVKLKPFLPTIYDEFYENSLPYDFIIALNESYFAEFADKDKY